jgi:hypothetical protein
VSEVAMRSGIAGMSRRQMSFSEDDVPHLSCRCWKCGDSTSMPPRSAPTLVLKDFRESKYGHHSWRELYAVLHTCPNKDCYGRPSAITHGPAKTFSSSLILLSIAPTRRRKRSHFGRGHCCNMPMTVAEHPPHASPQRSARSRPCWPKRATANASQA